MQFGVALPHYLEQASPAAIREACAAAEEMGFDSVWASDHIVVPDSPRWAWSNTFYEPLAVLAYAASATRRVRLGTSVLVAPHRHPVYTAKALATIDQLSGGRLIPCFGTGGIQEEFEALGLPWGQRGPMTDEAIQAMKALWTEQAASFQGRFFRFHRMKCSPKPAQRPLPVWIGGNTRRAIRRAVELGDGWHPIGRMPERLAEGIAHLRALAAQRGRALLPEVSVRISLKLEAWRTEAGERKPMQGNPEEVAGDLKRYAKLGVGHVVLDLLADIPRMTEQMRRFAAEVRPAVTE